MATNTVAAEQLREGTTVVLRGMLGFARLARVIEGEELAKADARRVQNGMSPVGQPHTTATITQAEVVYADPDNPTPEELFVAERRYVSKKNPGTGLNYSIDSKGSILPVIATPAPTGDGTYAQDTSGQELASGQEVMLVLGIYKPKNYNKRGLRIDQVVVTNPPKYYSPGFDAEALAARGIVFATPPRAVSAANVQPVGEAPPVPTDVDDQGLAFPAPQPQYQQPHAPVAAVAPAAQPQAPAEVSPATPANAVPPTAVAAVPTQPLQAQPQQAETVEQKLARLEELERQQALQNAGSAVGAGPVAAASTQSPWNLPGVAPGIAYQG